MITWTASNSSSYLSSARSAHTLLAAVRAARAYLRSEIDGEGKITYYDGGVEIREDRIDIYTGYRWETRQL